MSQRTLFPGDAPPPTWSEDGDLDFSGTANLEDVLLLMEPEKRTAFRRACGVIIAPADYQSPGTLEGHLDA